MKRILYTLKQAFRHKHELRSFLKNPAKSCRSILDITPEVLHSKGISVLVLDFDGVLSAHDAPVPLMQIVEWLHHLQKNWPHSIFIFSNKPSVQRQAYFEKHFPGIGFIKGVERKPYPEGLLQIQAQTGENPSKILMVDDRLFTGILASVLARTQAVWLSKPIINFKHHFFKEIWFQFLRGMDRLLLKI